MYKTSGFLLSFLMVCPIYPYTATQNGVTLSAFDYSKRPMARFFADLTKDCHVTIFNINTFNQLYPIRLEITNTGEKTYNLMPHHIGGALETDYKKLQAHLLIEAEGNGGVILSILAGIIGLPLGAAVGFVGVIHHMEAKYNDDCKKLKHDFIEHLKHCNAMQKLMGYSVGLGSIGLLGMMYCCSKINTIRNKQLQWLTKHALPKEGMTIKPGEHRELVVFLKQEAYDQSHIILSLIEPAYLGGAKETFNVSLLS